MENTETPEEVLKNEESCLRKEFEWVLREEVSPVLNRVHKILVECCRKFPIAVSENDTVVKVERRYILTAPPEKLKTYLTLCGDTIVHADIQFKSNRHHRSAVYRTSIRKDRPWRLLQLRDAANNLQQALFQVDNMRKQRASFYSSDEVLQPLEKILTYIHNCKSSLILPKKKSIEELKKSRETMNVVPSLPEDIVITFHINSQKIVFAVYQFHKTQNAVKFDIYQSECTIPWLNDVILMCTIASRIGQQLKDKITVFAQFKDVKISPKRQCKVTIKT